MSPSATGAVRHNGCDVGIGESSAGWVVVSDRDGSGMRMHEIELMLGYPSKPKTRICHL
jgi:hypothetical protein